MPIAAKLDEWGLPAWIALMILSFWVFWPLGLVVLAFLIGSGRMGCGGYRGVDRWQRKMERMQAKMDYVRNCMEQARATGYWGGPWGQQPPSSGNHAFDEYRTETLRRLEEEQREFKDFLERLRFAKDRTEFEQFMAERRGRTGTGPTGPAPQPQG